MTEDLSNSPQAVSARPRLERLANLRGVSTQYWDWQGNHVPVSVATTVAVLDAFGIDAHDDEAVERALAEVEIAPWRRTLPVIVIAREGTPAEVPVHVPHGSPVHVEVVAEDGSVLDAVQVTDDTPPRAVDGILTGQARFQLRDLPLGYHTLHARVGGGAGADYEATAPVVVAPDRLKPPDVPGKDQAWGVMTQLYSVRSRRSWGLGDFADLADLAAWGAGTGADFVLVNPLHAAQPVPPIESSPYLPTTRRFVNPIYVRVEDVRETAYLAEPQQARVRELAAAVSRGNSDGEALLDRAASYGAKLEALSMVFDVPRSVSRQRDYTAFLDREGEGLTQFALWSALYEHFGQNPDLLDESGNWPKWTQDADSPELADARTELAARIDFFCWLQWLADEQLAAAQRAALDSGMRFGLMTDLAVGVHPTGADTWTLGDALARGVSVGAPPDPFNQLGQNWSQPPWRPDVLAELAYQPYRDMLRTVLRHCGGLRIDHVMGLFRLWCIPHGSPPGDGAYVRYDYEAMVSILLLEAHRAGAFVVGEDLGVVEPFVREYLAQRGVLGTSILWFERDDAGRPRPPHTYRELCLATVTTHDLPPTAGYLAGEHIALRDELGLLTRSVEEETEVAREEVETVVRALQDEGLLDRTKSWQDLPEEQVVAALHAFLLRAPSRLVGVMVSDMVGDRRTQNQPGTDQEYPNWRVPLADGNGRAVLLEDLPDNERASRLAELLSRGRPR